MRFHRHFIATCALLALSIATVAYASDDSSAKSAFRAGTAEWVAAYNANEPDRIVALYAADAVVMPPDAPAVSGHAAVRSFLVKDIATTKAAGLTLSITHGAAGASGNLGWDSGTFKVVDTGGKTVGTGKFAAIWERQAGKWRMIRDIWNNDAPPAPAAAPVPANTD